MSIERHAAAENLLAAYRELQNYYSFQTLFESIRENIADGELSFDYNVSNQLSSFVQRLKAFASEVDAFQEEMEQRFENAAWDYLSLEYGIHRGDRVQRVEDGKTEIATLEHFYMNDPDPKDLTAEGHVVRKRGSIGTRRARVRFGYDKWTRIPFPQPSAENQ
jgi:hypothetical protein